MDWRSAAPRFALSVKAAFGVDVRVTGSGAGVDSVHDSADSRFFESYLACLGNRPMTELKRENSGVRTRLAPEARRSQLLEVASRILFERGVEAVRIPELAECAGVTRPVVYRFFPNRQAIFVALLEELGSEIDLRLALFTQRRVSTETLVTEFVFAICDAIEACGPGAWVLMGGAALDEEVRVVVAAVEQRLTRPWMERVARLMPQMEASEVAAVTSILVASSRAVLRLWLIGELTRDAAATLLSRSVRSVLREFAGNLE